MSLDGSSYARGNQLQRPTFAPYEPQRGSVSFLPQPQPASGQEKTLDALQDQSQFAHVLKLQTTRPFDGKDFFTWSFEFELMMEGAQILGFFDGSLPYPTHGTQYDKQQYTYQSMMAYTILLRNITPSHQQNIRSYRGYGNSAELAYNHLKNLYQATDSVLQRFDFTYSSPQATPLSTRHSLSALPSDESVEPSGPYPELVGCLMYLMTCTRPDLAYPLSILACYVAPGRHRPEHMAAAKRVLRYLCSTLGMGLVLGGRRPVVLTGHADASWADDQATLRSSQGYTFSLGSGSVSWRSTRSSSVLSCSCEAEIYSGAMAAQELRWLTYLLSDLGEQPLSPPVLYVDNKAMMALCREHRLEHRTKHIALRYFLARELQQRGQLRLAYVASEANTADIFTKALPPGDHQRFCTVL
ncbi:unnamed protein product, partial [Closterium sp. NIES-53]